LSDELRRRYLQQQIELGGREVILSPRPAASRVRPPVVAEHVVPAYEPARTEPAAAVTAAAEERVAVPTAAGGEAPPGGKGARHWSVGAPPIPGPGLVVETESTLQDEEFRQLATLEQVAERVAACTRCGLAHTRTRTVPGEGAPRARLMLVGEGPGANEDATGRPFVGAAGQLLDRILEAIETPRETVFIANIVKCRPPQNRKPLPDEMAACLPYLRRQIALVQPAVLVALGGTATEGLLGVKKGLGELRGKVHRWNGIPLIVTYHPAALLRNPNWKKPTWDDIRIARQLLDR
jgi:DNA polymerase